MAGLQQFKPKPPADMKLVGMPGYTQPSTITPITAAERPGFEKWIKDEKIRYDPSPNADYDTPGLYRAYLAGDPKAAADPVSGHHSDWWKRENHPTFSIDSQYSRGALYDPHWVGDDTQGWKLVNPDGSVKIEEKPMPRKNELMPPPSPQLPKVAMGLPSQASGAGLMTAVPSPMPVMRSLTPTMDSSAQLGIPPVMPGGPQPAAEQASAAPMVDPYTAQYTAMYKALNPQISLGEQEMGKLQQARDSMLDTALNGGMTKQERAEAKVGGIFSDVIAPIAGLLGGNGTASGALSFINQEKQDLALKKAQAKANQTAAFSALKGLYDIYGKVDPNSLQQHGKQMNATVKAVDNANKAAAREDQLIINRQKADALDQDYQSKKEMRDAEIRRLTDLWTSYPEDSKAKRDALNALTQLHTEQKEALAIHKQSIKALDEQDILKGKAETEAIPKRVSAYAQSVKNTEELIKQGTLPLRTAQTNVATAKGKVEAEKANQALGKAEAQKAPPPPKGMSEAYRNIVNGALGLSDSDLQEWALEPDAGGKLHIPKERLTDPAKIRDYLNSYSEVHLD